jgi:hypothetical protein
MRYWRTDGTVVPENTTPVWYKQKPSAYAIETASYALLAQLAIGGAAEDYFQYAGPIASWLIRQRTITGAFVSTTVCYHTQFIFLAPANSCYKGPPVGMNPFWSMLLSVVER